MPGIDLLQAGDFGTAKIFACIIFGAIGFAVFVYGKKIKSFRHLMVGAALMAYPYFVSGTFLLYFVGIALTAALYFWRD